MKIVSKCCKAEIVRAGKCHCPTCSACGQKIVTVGTSTIATLQGPSAMARIREILHLPEDPA